MPKETRRLSHQKYDDECFENATSRVGGINGGLHLMDGLIPTFTGQDKTYPVTRWVQDVEDNAEVYGWTPTQQLLMARRSLKGTAALWLRAERAYKSWDELKTSIIKEFPDSLDIKAVHEMMSARVKKANESCLDYVLTMKELGRRGKMPDYVAIKYIVDGIQDIETNKIMLYGVTTYADLKEKMKIYEAVKEKMKHSTASSRSSAKQAVNRGEPAVSVNKSRCYGCGSPHHKSEQCPDRARGRKCFHCNDFGHISAECPKKIASSTSNMADEHSSRQPGSTRLNPKRSFFNTTDGGAAVDDVVSREVHGSATALAIGQHGGHVSKCQNDFDVYEVNNNKPLEGSEIRRKPLKEVKINGKTTDALVDSGSDINLVTDDLFWKIGVSNIDYSANLRVSGLGQFSTTTCGSFTINIEIDSKVYESVLFYIMKSDFMPYDIILGNDFLKNVTMCMRGNSVRFSTKDDDWLQCMMCDEVFSDFPSTDHIKNTEVRREVQCLVESYVPKQTKESPIQMKIVLKDDIPVSQRPRRISLKEQQEVEKQITEWLEKGIVRVSHSEYTSPLVLVRKKDNSVRICIDYRKLNQKIVKDEFPLPIIDDCIDKLSEAKVFSVIDLKNGFFHLPISKESIKYTSFVTHNSQYEFLKAPFGLSICPNYFMRFVSAVFRDLISKSKVIIFIDDIVIPARDEFEALSRLKEVLKVAAEYGLQINWKKASLITPKITFLGHIIENGEVRPSLEKTEAIMKFPEPRTVKQVHSFIGLASYFRKYINNFALIASPLTDLLKKDCKFEFGERERESFNILKQKLISSPVLRIFSPKTHTELHTDASSLACAAILMQNDTDGNLHPVYYMSRKTNEYEKKYSSYELEALAVIEGVKKFRHYLYGIKFKIVTDCQAFELTLRKKDLTTRVARWALLLQEFDFVVEHRSGKRMKHVDALSRNPYVGVTTSIHDTLKRAQEQDEGLKAIATILKDKSFEDYSLQNGLLYKGAEKLLVVPKNMEAAIIEKAHSNGHFALKKTVDLISKDYFIQNLEQKVQNYISSCIPCLLAMGKKGKEGFLHPIHKEDIPLHTIHLDHIGPMSETKKQYNHILTVIDGFTKFIWLFPVKTVTAAETLNKLRIHQQVFRNPRRIITDRGTAFTSNEFADFCNEEGIQHVKITTGVPRGNGQVERVHRDIIAILTKLCIEDASLWFRHVSRVQRAINSTFHRSINTSPFELLTGVKMNTGIDANIYEMLRQEERDGFAEERENLRRRAKEQILKVQEENEKGYNKKRKEGTEYDVGELVAIKRTQFGSGLKIKPKFFGPYKVTKVKRNDRYDVEKVFNDREGPNKTSTSADNMKKWPSGF